MNTLNKTLMAALLTCLIALPALAGPSDGTGTNINLDKNMLTDEVKFKAEFGEKKPVLIDVENYRTKSGMVPYQEIKAKLDRLAYLYPGSEEGIKKVLEKTWLVRDKDLGARTNGEKKVIAQTDDMVYVDMKWLKSASNEQIKEAFLHEAVRGVAKDMVATYFRYDQHKEGIEDRITETISPAIFRDLPQNLLKKQVDDMMANLTYRWDLHRPTDPISELHIAGREEIYAALNKSGARKYFQDMCLNLSSDPEKAKLYLEKNYGSDEPGWINTKLTNTLAPLAKFSDWGEDHSGVNTVTLGGIDGNGRLLENLYMMSGKSAGITIIVNHCLANRTQNAKFLKEYDLDQGKMRPDMVKIHKATSLPDDEEEKSAGQRAAE
ncbi:MAG: hypothetical protein ACXVBE_17705 [Bdellovibrionota bacterium]